MTPAYHIDLQMLDGGISQLERFSWTGLLLHGKMSAYLKSAFRKFCVFFFVFGPVIEQIVKNVERDFKMRFMGFIAKLEMILLAFVSGCCRKLIVGKRKIQRKFFQFQI